MLSSLYLLTYSHLYIIVINSNLIASSTKRMISNVEEITTRDMLEESMKEFPLYYVAGVVNANQYLADYGMRYYLGAEDFTTEDFTTDVDRYEFYNKKLSDGLAYFF